MHGGLFGILLQQRTLCLDRWGIMAHYSKSNVAYLDFDFARPDRRSPRLRPIFTVLRIVGLRPVLSTIEMERTRHGWHVIIPLREKLEPAELVALQLALGDDQRRGALNLMRARAMRQGRECNGVTGHWRRRWNILFGGKLS